MRGSAEQYIRELQQQNRKLTSALEEAEAKTIAERQNGQELTLRLAEAERERDQQTRFKYRANQRAEKAERERDELQRRIEPAENALVHRHRTGERDG